MIQHTTAFDVAAEVQMTRSGFRGTILVVEGGHDCRIYERFVRDGDCRVIPAHGKDNACEAIAIAERAATPGVLAVVDADFWRIVGIPHASTNIIATDAHDIEAMMIESRALDVVLREYAISKKAKAFVAANKAAHLRDVLFLRALPLGLLRLISEERSLRLKFRGIDHSVIVSRSSLIIDEKLLAAEVAKLTGAGRVSPDQVVRLLKQSKKRRCEARQACCGHDMTAIIAIALQYAVGAQKASIATSENVERWLRMSYDLRDFRTTNLYSETKTWEAANAPYKVFQ